MNHIRCAALMPHPPMAIPEVGKEETVKIQATVKALDAVSQSFKESTVQTVVIISPHGLGFDDSITMSVHPRLRGTMAAFGAPDLSLAFETDGLLLRMIDKQAERLGINLIKMTDDKAKSLRFHLTLDYGALVPLYYLHKAGFRGQIIHLSCGPVPYEEMYTFGKAVQSATAIVDKKIGIIASGNLSHCMTEVIPNQIQPRAAEFDRFIVEALNKGDFKTLMNVDRALASEIDECGLRPIFFLMGVLGGKPIASQVLSYEAPLGVGYAVVKFMLKQ